MDKLGPYLKALVGFITPGAVLIGSAVTEASDGGTKITAAEWITAVVACIVTGGAVYSVENKPLARNERGEVNTTTMLLVGVLITLILIFLVLAGALDFGGK